MRLQKSVSSRSIEKETCTCLTRVSYGSYVISVYRYIPSKQNGFKGFALLMSALPNFSEEADWHWKQDTFDLNKLGNMETS